MNLVETHIIKKGDKFYDEADKVSFAAKNLYNYANYLVRQEFINTSKEKEEGKREFAIYKNYHVIRRELKGQADYIVLPQKVSNHVLKMLDKSWRSFFASIKGWKVNPGKYLGRPSLPNYLDKEEGRYTVSYEKGAISRKELKNGFVKLSGTNIMIPFINKDKQLVGARIVPTSNNEYKLEIIYKEPALKPKEEGIVAGIDIGVNNLIALTFGEKEITPKLISGRPLKSMNQYYNKKKAELQEKLSKAQPNKKKKVEVVAENKEEDKKREPKEQKTSNAIKKLTADRNHKVDGYMHKSTSVAIDECVKNNVKELIIGKNPNWKQNCNIGKKNNQNFVFIPFTKMIKMLSYKAALVGIKVTITEEAYTSKCSFLDLEEMCHHDKYLGKRTSRGCFKSATGKIINADINGSYNCIRKVVPEIFKQGIEGFAVNPVSLIIHK